MLLYSCSWLLAMVMLAGALTLTVVESFGPSIVHVQPSSRISQQHQQQLHVVAQSMLPNNEEEGASSSSPASSSSSSSSSSPSLAPEDALDLIRFQRRQEQLEKQRLAQQQQQPLPPHPSLEPQQVVTAVLQDLRATPHYYDFDPLRPRPHPGVACLWEASTVEWQQTMAAMVGLAAPTTTAPTPTTNNAADDATPIVVAALGRFLARPQQQFAILLGMEDANYQIEYPTDVIEWSDDEAWLECRLRSAADGELLVVLGWTFHRQPQQPASSSSSSSSDDDSRCWYIHAFDWQDFRNDYRPGMGREEWERICG